MGTRRQGQRLGQSRPADGGSDQGVDGPADGGRERRRARTAPSRRPRACGRRAGVRAASVLRGGRGRGPVRAGCPAHRRHGPRRPARSRRARAAAGCRGSAAPGPRLLSLRLRARPPAAPRASGPAAVAAGPRPRPLLLVPAPLSRPGGGFSGTRPGGGPLSAHTPHRGAAPRPGGTPPQSAGSARTSPEAVSRRPGAVGGRRRIGLPAPEAERLHVVGGNPPA